MQVLLLFLNLKDCVISQLNKKPIKQDPELRHDPKVKNLDIQSCCLIFSHYILTMSCDKRMTFEECELAILRAAIDKAEEKQGKKNYTR